MSGALDIRARALAERLLKKYGKKAVFTDVVESGYVPGVGTIPTPTDYDVTCFIDMQKTGQFRSLGLIESTELVVLVSPKELGVEVDNTDKITIGTVKYSIIKDMPDWSGEEICLHNIICKVS